MVVCVGGVFLRNGRDLKGHVPAGLLVCRGPLGDSEQGPAPVVTASKVDRMIHAAETLPADLMEVRS